MKEINLIFLFFLVILLGEGCARRGMPSGGDKDTKPPVVVEEIPPSGTTGFNRKKITLKFDEFIQLDNPLQKIVFSPPLKKAPKITPLGYPSKKIEITFTDTLLPGTTYSIYFNDAIKDYHEGNVLKNYRYVFSTGPAIDTLSLYGQVSPAYDFDLPENIQVVLYPFSAYSDSLLYFAKPYYLTQADESGKFSFRYLSPGQYRIFAFSDKNHSLNYQPGEEQIAFLNDTVTLPGAKEIHLVMFKEKQPLKIEDITQKSLNRWSATFQGDYDRVKMKVSGKSVFYYPVNNHIDIWIKKVNPGDTLDFSIYQDTVRIYEARRIAERKPADSLFFRFSSPRIYPMDTLSLYPTIPLVFFDSTKIKSIPAVPFHLKRSAGGSLNFVFHIISNPPVETRIMLLPGALKDYLGHINKDTVQQKVAFVSPNKTGNIVCEIDTIPSGPLILELVDLKSGKIVRRNILKNTRAFSFKYLKPGKYRLRIIWDTNGNGRWDTGDLEQGRQPERVFLYPKEWDVRANWFLKEKISLPLD